MAYDLIIVGGGLAGSSLAIVMAQAGAHVLLLEREPKYRDRVRGEGMHPWGIAEARKLGIYHPLLESCGHEVRWWNNYDDALIVSPRDLMETTPHSAGSLNFHHPEMQELLLQMAISAGADVRRGVTVTALAPGRLPEVEMKKDGSLDSANARMVVGADGRASSVRASAGFQVNHDPERLMIASILLRDLTLDESGVHVKYDPLGKQLVIIFPLGKSRFRIYFIYCANGSRRGLSGAGQVTNFIASCIAAGTPAAWYEQATPSGPLAEYSGAASWITHPYANGIALVGDAAGHSDPSWGCGLSLALRDVRVLSQELLSHNDWEQAAHSYAEQRERYFGVLHQIEEWNTMLMYDSGIEADERLKRAFAKQRKNIPDIVGLGPDSPCDEAARRRFFGEE